MEELTDEAIGAAADCLVNARYAIALTGAGLSIDSGIPPFRGPGGLWTKHGEPPMDGYQRFLADPKQAWIDRLNPRGPMADLWAALRDARPNTGHMALVELETLGVLRMVISQNVDDLHRQAGSKQLLEIHGNATLIRCVDCVKRWRRDEIDIGVLPPLCPQCGGLLKSDTVSFGEPIPPDVLEGCYQESERADCVIVAGTSATVHPAAQFPIAVRDRGGDLIEVNPYETEISELCRFRLLGTTSEVLPRLCAAVRVRLGVS